MAVDLVPVRGRRAIAVMAIAAAALVLSGAAFLHTAANPKRVNPAGSSQVAAAAPAEPRIIPATRTAVTRSHPLTLSEAEAAAQKEGLPLMKPGWLPFRSSPADGPRQVEELSDSGGKLDIITTIYYGPDGQMVVITQQFQPGPLSVPNTEGAGLVGSSPATWFSSGPGIGIAWIRPGGRYVMVQGTGLTQDQLLRVAESMA